MARQFTYVVIRHGSNAANQSMTPRLAVGFVEARNQSEAIDRAVAAFTFYNNQVCEVVPISRARKSDVEEAGLAQWARDAEQATIEEYVR